MDIEGSIYKIMPLVKGEGRNGKEWSKQEFVIEIEDQQFPKKICFSCWGDKISSLNQIKTGDKVKISFSAESREYNERWFTDLRAYRIDKVGTQSTSSQGEEFIPPEPFDNSIPPSDDLPF